MLGDGAFETPVVISNQEYRFLVAEQLAEIGREARIVLEPVRRDSGPAVAVGAEIAAEAGPDTDRRRARRRSCGAGQGRFHRALQAGGRGGRARLYRDAGDQADGAGDRLWLHQDGQGCDGEWRCPEDRGLRRKARRRDGRKIHRGKLSLELRQFLFSRRRHAGRVAKIRAGHRRGRGRGGRQRPRSISISSCSTRTPSAGRRKSRSTTRSWSAPARRRSRPPTSAGRTSAIGAPSGNCRTATQTAIRRAAMASSSTPRMCLCARPTI